MFMQTSISRFLSGDMPSMMLGDGLSSGFVLIGMATMSNLIPYDSIFSRYALGTSAVHLSALPGGYP